MQDDPSTPDHEGGRRDVGQVGGLVQGTVQPLQLGQDDGSGQRLTLVGGPVVPDRPEDAGRASVG